jgi:hypothetical protein
MKNNYVRLLSIVLVAILVGQVVVFTRVYAQESKAFADKNTVELGGNISYQYESFIAQGSVTGNLNTLSFLPYIGYFVADNIEIGLNPVNITSMWISHSTTTMYSIFLAPSYNFKTEGNIYPFVEAQLGYTSVIASYSSSNLTGFSWGGRTGIKIALVGHGLINLGLQYQHITQNPSYSTNRYGENNIMFSAGFTLWY